MENNNAPAPVPPSPPFSNLHSSFSDPPSSPFSVPRSQFCVAPSSPSSVPPFSIPHSAFCVSPSPAPWPEPVPGADLLDALAQVFTRFIVLPRWAPETLALWTLHTYAFELRDVTAYLGIESPQKRCGKSTLLTVLRDLVNRPLLSTNISPSAFFRVIEELRPTLLIDEADRLLKRNDELQGILNAGYTRSTAYVVRTCYLRNPESPEPGPSDGPGLRPDPGPAASGLLPSNPVGLARFSAWCPKALAGIGRLPETLADRCILIQMQRKAATEQCERLRDLAAAPLRQQCVRFVRDHQQDIARAQPQIPPALNDRAADIWEPLFALADLAGGAWPERARQAAAGLNAGAEEASPMGMFLFYISSVLANAGGDRIFSRDLADDLNAFTDRPWTPLKKGKDITELWLAQQLRPYGVFPINIRIGENRARGYIFEDFRNAFRRYIPPSEIEALRAQVLAYRQELASPGPELRTKDEGRGTTGLT